MKKVIILQGLPASGKTTFAKKLMKENPSVQYKRINKDELRAMLDGGVWSKHNEKFILKVRDTLILEALEDGRQVIVDDTNLHPKHLLAIGQLVKGKAEVVVHEFTGVSPEECIRRDLARERSVGSKVIMGMYEQFLKPKVSIVPHDGSLPNCIIVDIDGTVAKMKGRGPYDWGRVGEDEPNQPVLDILSLYKEETPIIFVSGRDAICKFETVAWLDKHNVFWSSVYLRPEGDTRKDSIIKEEIYDRYIKGTYNVLFVLDDRDQTVAKWRELGLTCLQVAEGDF